MSMSLKEARDLLLPGLRGFCGKSTGCEFDMEVCPEGLKITGINKSTKKSIWKFISTNSITNDSYKSIFRPMLYDMVKELTKERPVWNNCK